MYLAIWQLGAYGLGAKDHLKQSPLLRQNTLAYWRRRIIKLPNASCAQNAIAQSSRIFLTSTFSKKLLKNNSIAGFFIFPTFGHISLNFRLKSLDRRLFCWIVMVVNRKQLTGKKWAEKLFGNQTRSISGSVSISFIIKNWQPSRQCIPLNYLSKLTWPNQVTGATFSTTFPRGGKWAS